jgi:hypothetical protein
MKIDKYNLNEIVNLSIVPLLCVGKKTLRISVSGKQYMRVCAQVDTPVSK